MAAARLPHRGLLPPARLESAANPTMVSVSTVVVRSGTPSFRTTALRSPITTAVKAMTRAILSLLSSYGARNPIETADATHRRMVSTARAWTGVEPGSCGFIVLVIHPPSTAPLIKKRDSLEEFVG